VERDLIYIIKHIIFVAICTKTIERDVEHLEVSNGAKNFSSAWKIIKSSDNRMMTVAMSPALRVEMSTMIVHLYSNNTREDPAIIIHGVILCRENWPLNHNLHGITIYVSISTIASESVAKIYCSVCCNNCLMQRRGRCVKVKWENQVHNSYSWRCWVTGVDSKFPCALRYSSVVHSKFST